MADKLLVCCMDNRFFDGTFKLAQEFFGVGPKEFYVMALAGGPKFLADIDKVFYDGISGDYKKLIFLLKWSMDQGLASIKIFCENNPQGTILLVSHLETCKGYGAVLKGLSQQDEQVFQSNELTKAARTIQKNFPGIKVAKKVAKLEKGEVVFV